MNRFALSLVIAGALNWLLIGIFQLDLVAAIFGGQASAFSRIIYVLIGVAGIWAFTFWNKVAREAPRESYRRREAMNYEFGRDYDTRSSRYGAQDKNDLDRD